jgi:hypothetical protein
MDQTIIDRIAFGGVKELEELYQQQVLSEMLLETRVSGHVVPYRSCFCIL